MMILMFVLDNSHSKKILMFDNVKEAKEFLSGRSKNMQKKVLADDGKKHKHNNDELSYEHFLHEMLYGDDIKAAADERCTDKDYQKDYYNSYCSELFTCEYNDGIIYTNKCYTKHQWFLRSSCVEEFECETVLNCYENKNCRENMKCYKDSEIKKKVDCWIGGHVWSESIGHCISLDECHENDDCFYELNHYRFPCY